jgi:precorrin-6B methylase 2
VTSAECPYCERRCRLAEGQVGFCQMYTCTDGQVVERFPHHYSCMYVNHIENVPFYHFQPGSRIFVLGGAGCNFDCEYCSNAYVARSEAEPLLRYHPNSIEGKPSMERATDWIRLWRELVEVQARRWAARNRERGRDDAWKAKARSFDAKVRERWAKPDSSRQAVLAALQAQPGATVLDIGAGTGAWACLLARHARLVTAVEPSPTMIEVMEENLAAEGVQNVQIVQGAWPDVDVAAHDFSLCSHAMYGYPDLPAFLRRMIEVTRQTCFLVMRVPTVDGVLAEAAMRVWGHPHDSPNFQVGYNAMLQMGLFPNVLMEDTGLWDAWTHDSLEEALADVKRRLELPESEPSEHDAFLRELLRRRLTWQDGHYVWPPGVRSALVYWNAKS